jgi:DNA-binding transcriptional ArsR family regulator
MIVVQATATQRRAEELSEQLAVLAEPHRLMMLRHLRRGDQYAGRLAEALGISAALASHHLGALVDAGLVTRRRRGPFVCFSANRADLEGLHDELGRLMGAVMPEDALAVAEPCQT